MTTTNPSRVYSEIRDAYLRYVDTAYWLRSEELMSERRSLLTGTDLLFTDVLLEPVLPYDAEIELAAVLEELQIDPKVEKLQVQLSSVRLRLPANRFGSESIRPSHSDSHFKKDWQRHATLS